MMQLLCNGVRLDLYEGGSLQFTHSNPLFAFDKMSCERTTEFSIPSTPTNDQVLALARVPSYSGAGMRDRFTAQLQCGTIVKDGYLYVSSYDGTDYKAIFVSGELLGLQTIKEAGSVRDILQYDQTLTWDDSTAVDADTATLPDIGAVKYNKNTTNYNPSVSVRWLIDEAATAIGATISFNNAEADDRQRYLSLGEEYTLEDVAVHLTNDPDASQDPVNISSFLGLVKYVEVVSYVWNMTAISDGSLDWDWDNATQQSTSQFYQISLPYDCSITFPTSTPENLCIVTGNIMVTSNGSARLPVFIGSRRFTGGVDEDGTINYYGAPLAGQKVFIPADTPFMLTDGTPLVYPAPQYVGEQETVGFVASNVPAYDIIVNISIDHKWTYGENIPYNALLPDVTLVDILKTYAAINGCVLNYEDGQVTFEDLDYTAYTSIDCNAITKRGDVVRSFADYGQINTISFDSGDYVPYAYKIITSYTIDNANIEEEKELEVLKASEGRIMPIWDYDNEVIVDTFYAYTTTDVEPDAKTIFIADSNTSYSLMQRVSLPTIDGLQSLCTASTQFKIECRMTMTEYNAITSKTLLLVDNTLYIWTDRSWQNDVAKFTLAKIA